MEADDYYHSSWTLGVFSDELAARQALEYEQKGSAYGYELSEREVLGSFLDYLHSEALEIDKTRTERLRAEEERKVREALRDQQIKRGEIRDETLKHVRPAPHRISLAQMQREWEALQEPLT